MCYPLISDDGNRTFVTVESGETLFNLLLPTADRANLPKADTSMRDAIARLDAYKREHGIV